jgi:hypothetical protein
VESEHQLTVLMVDDDDEDCMLAAKAFAESGVNVAFSCVEDGVELMDYSHSTAPLRQNACLILSCSI